MTEEKKSLLMSYMLTGSISKEFKIMEGVSFKLRSLTVRETIEAENDVRGGSRLELDVELLSRSLVSFGDAVFSDKKEAGEFLQTRGTLHYGIINKAYTKMLEELTKALEESEVFFGNQPSLKD